MSRSDIKYQHKPIFLAEGKDSFDCWSWLSACYLALPVALFFLGWLKPIIGWPLFFGLCFILEQLGRTTQWRSTPTRHAIILILAALIWTSMSGIGHLTFANSDWGVRDAVLRDLANSPWPVAYRINTVDYLLRCPLAYYLPAAAIAKITGIAFASKILAVWTVLGVCLVLFNLPIARYSARVLTIAIVIFFLFSGMDIGGYILQKLYLPALGEHIEWWAKRYQYSSNTTLLFWVPNHALPAWLAMSLLYRHWRQPAFLNWALTIIGLLPLWSPFAAIGVLPFFALILAIRPKLSLGVVLHGGISLCIGIMCAIYLLAAASKVGHQPIDGEEQASAVKYFVFVIMEFGLLSFVLWRRHQTVSLAIAIGILLALPFFNFGPSNDLAMRASIPALFVLCILSIEFITKGMVPDRRYTVLALLLILGAATPINELIRASQWPARNFDTRTNLIQSAKGIPDHYVAAADHSWLQAVLKQPPQTIITSPTP